MTSHSNDSIEPLRRVEDGAEKLMKGADSYVHCLLNRSIGAVSSQVRGHLFRVAFIVGGVLCLSTAAFILLTTALVAYLVSHFGLAYWQASALVAAALLVLLSVGIAIYLIARSRSTVQPNNENVRTKLTIDSSTEQIETGIEEVRTGIAELFSLRRIVSEHPATSVLASGLAAAVAGYTLTPNGSDSGSDSKRKNQTRTSLLSKKTTDHSDGLLNTMVGAALPFVVSAIQGKIAEQIEQWRENAKRDRRRSTPGTNASGEPLIH